MPCRWSKEPDCVPAYSLHRSPRHGRRDLLAAPGRRLGLLLAADGGLPLLPQSCSAALPLRAHRQPGDHGAARPYGGEPPAPSHCARHGHACRGRAPGRLASALPQRTATRPNGGPASRHFGVTSLCPAAIVHAMRSEEHTSELQSLMRISYAVLALKKKKTKLQKNKSQY